MAEAQELSLRARRKGKKGNGRGGGGKVRKGTETFSPRFPPFCPSSQSPTPFHTPAVQTTRVYNLIYGRPGIILPFLAFRFNLMHWNPLSNKCRRNSARNKRGLKKFISLCSIPSSLFGNLMLVFEICLFKLYLICTKRSFSPVFALLCANPGHARVATDVDVFVNLRFCLQALQSL